MNSIVLKNIIKKYGKDSIALNDVSFSINEGEFIVIIGPSGCGKTTLLKLIAGLENQTSGELFIFDKNSRELEPHERNLSMVFQNYALYPHMTVYQNIAFPLKLKKIKKDVLKKKVMSVAKFLGIDNLLDRYPSQLSGGQCQRVAIGRAIIKTPKICLFDEPLSNLDAQLKNSMRVEIKNLHKTLNSTFVYVTHDQKEAVSLADKIIVLDKGKIQQIGTPDEIYNNPTSKFVFEFIGDNPVNIVEVDIRIINGRICINNDKFDLSYEIGEDINIGGNFQDGKYLLGFRSNAVKINKSNTSKMKVSFIEHYNDNIRLLIRNDETKTSFLYFDTIKEQNIEEGDSVEINLPFNKLFFFDYQTEKNIFCNM